MKFWVATKGIVYTPHKYTDGEKRYFSSEEKAMKWLGFVGKKQGSAPGYSWHSTENMLEQVDIQKG